MSFSTLPADVVSKVTGFLLRARDGPVRTGDKENKSRLLDFVRCLSTDKAAWALYQDDPRFKALLFVCLHEKNLVIFVSDDHSPPLLPPDSWGRDRAIVLAAAKIEGTRLLKADPSFLDDKEVVLHALRNEDRLKSWAERVYVRLSETLRLDHDVVRAALHMGFVSPDLTLSAPWDRRDFSVPETFPAAVRDDKALMLEVMGWGLADTKCFCPLAIASERLRNDREVVLAAVSQRTQGSEKGEKPRPNLKDASEALRDDRAVVEAAVRATRGGFVSLAVASERLRDDLDLAALAVSVYAPTSGVDIDKGYEAMSERVRGDRTLFLELLAKADDPALRHPHMPRRSHPSRAAFLLRTAAPALKADKEIVLAALTKEAGDICCYRPVIGEAALALQQDRDVLLLAMGFDGRKLSYAPPAMKNDKTVVLRAVRRTGSALEFASEALRDDYDVCLAACENEGAALEWVSRRLRDERCIRGAARAERAALLKRAGGAEKLGYPFVPGQTLEEHDRERRAAAFNLRPGTHDASGCWGITLF